MSQKVTLDHIEIQRAIERAKAARAEYMRQYGTAALRVFGSKLRAHHAIAVIAVLLISFGVKMFYFPAPTAEANTHDVPSVSWPLP
ncbi:MAG: hypothetical protein ACM3IH_14175 [Sphingobacteriales bacterium]|jgi:hypothetical protein